MKKLLFALSIGLAVLSGCARQPTVGGTVISVTEVPVQEVRQSPTRYEGLLVPEVAWKVHVRLEDGRAVTVTETGERRHQPGQRVRVLLSEKDALLL